MAKVAKSTADRVGFGAMETDDLHTVAMKYGPRLTDGHIEVRLARTQYMMIYLLCGSDKVAALRVANILIRKTGLSDEDGVLTESRKVVTESGMIEDEHIRSVARTLRPALRVTGHPNMSSPGTWDPVKHKPRRKKPTKKNRAKSDE